MAKLDEVQKETTVTLRSSLQRRKTIDLSVCLQPACFIIPDCGIFTPYECSFL